jgi:CheY-like chemotaxis protein
LPIDAKSPIPCPAVSLLLVSRVIEFPKPIRILVVDDDPAYVRLLGLFLRRYGYTVVSATSGKAALQFAGEADLALVDMIMPDLDGLETIALLRRRNPKLKVIASSGCAESEFRADLDRLGIEHFLLKPFTPERLIEEVEAFVAPLAA